MIPKSRAQRGGSRVQGPRSRVRGERGEGKLVLFIETLTLKEIPF